MLKLFPSKKKEEDPSVKEADVAKIREAEKAKLKEAHVAKMSEAEKAKLKVLDADMSKQLNSKMDMLNSAAEDEGGKQVTHAKLDDAVTALEAVMDQDAALFSGPAVWALGALGKTRRELVVAFCNHADVRDADGTLQGYDCDKATRRLKKYAAGMHKNGFILDGITLERIQIMHESCKSRGWFRYLDVPDKQDRAIMLMSFTNTPLENFNKEFYQQMASYFFVLFHGLLFDPVCQEHGIIYVNDYTGLDFSIMFKMKDGVDAKTKDAMQELFIGSLPIKTKAFYLVNLPWWLEIPMKLVMVFIGKKLRDRMRFVSKRWRKVYREVADQEFWPSTMGGGGKPIEEWPCEKMDAYVAAYQKHATTSL